MKNFQFPVRYKLGGKVHSLTAGVKKNIAVAPTRAVESRAARHATLAVQKSTKGNLQYVRVANANLPSHRRLQSVRRAKYAFTAVEI